MELQLGEQREQELSLLQDIHFSDPFGDQSLDKPKNKKWFNKLVHWIRSDSPESKEKKKRHLSWSAGTEKENHKVMDCHKRDSGISLFSTNRRTSLLSAIPIVRQPKFSPAQKSQHLNEFKAFPYPKMKKQIVDNNKDAPITTTIIDETNQQVQTTGV
jgi:hypothetical protein